MASNPNSSSSGKGKQVGTSNTQNPYTPPTLPQTMGFDQFSNMPQPWNMPQPTLTPPYYYGPPRPEHEIPNINIPYTSAPTQMSQTAYTVGSSQQSTEHDTEIPNPIEGWCTSEEMASKKHRKSSVWNFFVLSRDETRAKCKTCNKIFSALSKAGTGHLSRHVRKCGEPSTDPTQPKISQYHPHGFTFNYETDRDELATYIVHSEQPFLLSEDDPFNHYIKKALQPQHKKISRKTIRSAAMKMFLECKQKLIDELGNLPCRVSLTADAWDSTYGYHYLCVTCHWVDNEWVLQKRIIHFKMLESPHTGLNIAHHIMSSIDTYNLRNKIMSMTFDNATSMTYSANMIRQQLTDVILEGEALHIRCICHVLNLCVRDGTIAIGPFYEKIRNAIIAINSSSMRLQEWKVFLRQQKLKVIKIKTDCATRWNSTYDMLCKAIEYKVPVTIFYNQKFPQFGLLEDDWTNCEKYMQFLQLLYNMTHCFSSVYNPCSQSFLYNACLLAQLFYEHRNQQAYDHYLPAMEEKWRKYYTKLPTIYIFASILDPRQKYDGTYLLLDIYFQCMELDDDVESYKRTVTSQFFDLYRTYETKYGTVTRFAPSQPSKNTNKRAKGLFAQAANMMSKFSGGDSSRRTESDVSELQMYVNYDFMKGIDEEEKYGLDLLDWWKGQSTKHPILAAMARDILAIQVSSVASERAFSASGRVLNDRRTSLSPESLEMCVCYKDWLDAQYRKQDQTYSLNDNDDGTSGSTSSQSTQCADDLAQEEDEED